MKKIKQKVINVRVSDTQKDAIRTNAKSLGMSVSQYITTLTEKGQINVIEGGKELAALIYELNNKLNKLEKYPVMNIQDLRNAISDSLICLKYHNERRYPNVNFKN